MKYTQGKWNTFFTADDDETEFAITANGTVICINGERNNEVNFANANLIASAPEMLELLKDILVEVRPEISRVNEAAGRTIFNPVATETIDMAKELIAKAEGK